HRPFAKALAGFHAKLAGFDLVAQKRRRPGRIAVEHLGDVEREIEPNQIGLLHRPKHRSTRAESFAHHRVDRLRIADTRRDQRNGFAFHRMLQPIADWTGTLPAWRS